MSSISEKRFQKSTVKKVSLFEEYKEKIILDVGGGGEGIIGKIYGRNVISIDRKLDEIEETQNNSIKIVMDACNMNFTSNQFDVVTIFYTLMYMNAEEKERCIAESRRVLKPDGILEIWDVNIPAYNNDGKDIYLLQLHINMPNESIETGYGVLMTERRQDKMDIKDMLVTKGFEIIEDEVYESNLYRIKCVKRSGIA